MLRIIIVFTLFISAHLNLQAQHFDPIFSDFGEVEPVEKTWEDSGYYFVPTLVRFTIQDITTGPSDITSLDVLFQSTDMSSLMFTGQGAIFYRQDNIPPSLEIQTGTTGFATFLIPQSVLFCPSEEQEQGLGQEEALFPLSSVGRLNRIGAIMLPNPITILFQLNDLTVN